MLVQLQEGKRAAGSRSGDRSRKPPATKKLLYRIARGAGTRGGAAVWHGDCVYTVCVQDRESFGGRRRVGAGMADARAECDPNAPPILAP